MSVTTELLSASWSIPPTKFCVSCAEPTGFYTHSYRCLSRDMSIALPNYPESAISNVE